MSVSAVGLALMVPLLKAAVKRFYGTVACHLCSLNISNAGAEVKDNSGG